MRLFYTYILQDPRTEIYFYVGKGFDDRARKHLRYARKLEQAATKKDGNAHLYNTIRQILQAGFEPRIIFVQTHLPEEFALALECLLIKLIGRADLGLGPLLNLTNGGEGASGIIISPEECQNRSVRATKLYATEIGKVVVQSIKKSLQEYYNSPEGLAHRETISQIHSSFRHEEEIKKQIRASSTQFRSSPEGLEVSRMHGTKIRGRKRTYRDDGTYYYPPLEVNSW